MIACTVRHWKAAIISAIGLGGVCSVLLATERETDREGGRECLLLIAIDVLMCLGSARSPLKNATHIHSHLSSCDGG